MTGKLVMLGIAMLLSWPVYAQDLSTSVYLSEDELFEAYLTGEISYTRYLTLRDIMYEGIDREALHTLDEIPNLAHFRTTRSTLTTQLQKEQSTPYLKITTGSPASGELRYRYRFSFSDQQTDLYRLGFRFPAGRFSIFGNLRGDQYGNEQIINRCLTYNNPTRILREVRLGNFTRRLGLGVSFGHRGMILDYADRLGSESALFPHYGGYNGLYLQLKGKTIEVETLSSYNRDSSHSLGTIATHVSYRTGRFVTGIVIGGNRLENHQSEAVLYDSKLSAPLRYRYRNGYMQIEPCLQVSTNNGPAGLLIEGQHRWESSEIKYAAWSYADRYIDLSGGGKSGRLYRTIQLSSVDYSYSSRRTGQKGGMIRTIVKISERTRLINSAIYSGIERNNSELQLLTGLVSAVGTPVAWRIDHLVKSRPRSGVFPPDKYRRHRTRLEVRINTGVTHVRSYIAYNTSDERTDYLSLFVRLDHKTEKMGSFTFWSDLSRYDLNEGRFEYWYLFAQNEQPLFDGINLSFKLSHRYNTDGPEQQQSQVSIELTAVW